MLRNLIGIFLLYISFTFVLNQENADIVKDIPGFPYKGRMYSGYLEIKDKMKRYHYFFIESAQESYTAPLLLWLNGGPGCSSLSGFITENGPATFATPQSNLTINEYSWHKLGNMLYLESPGNVGFSRIDSDLEEELYIDDAITAQENFEALLDFFKKYPHFRQNDFYISGESYAGIYIPMLVKKVIDYNKSVPSSEKINLKGFLIGNGVASWDYDGEAALMDFAFTHHLVSYDMRKQYNEHCVDKYDEEKCNNIKDEIQDVNLKDLNVYDLMQDCWFPDSSEMTEEEIQSSYYYNYARWAFPRIFERKRVSKNKRHNFLSFIEEDTPKKQLKDYGPPCMDNRKPEEYLNRPEVQNAMHVTSVKWSTCAESVARRYKRSHSGSLHLYNELIKSGLKILIFSGDTDMAVPYNGNQNWINTLKMEIKSPWKSWRHPDDELNIAGYRQIYDGLTFVTFKGTGHMAVQWKARDAFYMLKQYLNDKDL